MAISSLMARVIINGIGEGGNRTGMAISRDYKEQLEGMKSPRQ